jgi:hypothetical protein
LCDEYWNADSRRGDATVQKQVFSDVQLKIKRQHGPTSWDAVVMLSPVASAGKPALLRLPNPVELQPNTCVRVLDASVTVDPESDDQLAIVTLGTFSETFSLARSRRCNAES